MDALLSRDQFYHRTAPRRTLYWHTLLGHWIEYSVLMPYIIALLFPVYVGDVFSF